MDKTIEQVKQLAHRYGVPKLVLFGSRARGDHHARSDYDFAVWGCTPQQRAQFSDAVENDLDSLYSVDLVFVSEHTDAALLQNIEKDGICLLDRYNTKFENLTNAVERLREGVQAYQENPAQIIRDGVPIFAHLLKALDYTIANDLGRILLIRLHAFAQAFYSIGEIFEFRIVTIQQANPVLLYILKQCCIGVFADKHQINRIQRVQIVFNSIAELRTLLRRASPYREIVVAAGVMIAAGTRTE